MPIQVRELIDVEVLERSLVGKPANKRRFICFKSDDLEGGDEPVTPETHTWDDVAREQFEEALNAAAAGEDEIVSKGVSIEAKNAIRGVLRILNSVKSELPDDVMEKLAALLGERPDKETKSRKKTKSVETAADPTPEPEPEPAPVPAPAKKNKGDGADGEPIPDMVMAVAKGAETPERGTAILEAYQTAPELIGGLVVPMLIQKDARIGELQDTIKPLLKERDDRAVTGIVDMLDLPGDREKHIAFIQALSPEQRADYIEAHKSTSEVTKSAMKGLTIAQGSDAIPEPTEDTALAEATRRAKAEISKSEDKISLTDAIYNAFRADPALYEQHCRETAGRD